jgi:hypothetical protein
MLCALLLSACGGGGAEVKQKRQPSGPVECFQSGIAPIRSHTQRVPELRRVLNDESRRGGWGEALLELGCIGTGDAFVRISTFVERRAPEMIFGEDLAVLQQAFMALGVMMGQPRHPGNANNALAYLLGGTDPHTWEKRGGAWRLDAVMRRELVRTLTLTSVRALSLSAREDARERLLALALDSADRRALRFKYQLTDAPQDAVSQLVNLHVLPPGRVAYGVSQVLKHVESQDASPAATNLRPIVVKLRSKALETWKLERQWIEARRGEENFLRQVQRADETADARLSGLHGQLESLRQLLDAPKERDAIDKIAEAMFPEGPLTLINATPADQVDRALAATAYLQKNLSVEVAQLKLTDHVRVARAAHQALDRALRLGQSGKGYDLVIRRRAELQVLLRIFLARVIANFPGTNKGIAKVQQSMRHPMLLPVIDQNTQVASYLQRLVPVRDVDPDTGQEVAPLADEGAAAAKERARALRDGDRR